MGGGGEGSVFELVWALTWCRSGLILLQFSLSFWWSPCDPRYFDIDRLVNVPMSEILADPGSRAVLPSFRSRGVRNDQRFDDMAQDFMCRCALRFFLVLLRLFSCFL